MNSSRRAFLKATAALAAVPGHVSPAAGRLALELAGVGALAASQAHAATTSDGYKALVCLFLQGGNDSHNWVVPLDSTNYASYATARSNLAVAQSRLTAITCTSQGSGRTFGMPQELLPLRTWYESGDCAIVANLGTLERPVTKTDYQNGVNLPPKLFSHNDQSSYWQSLQVEGAKAGWGGRMGDILMSANQYPVFTAMGTSNNSVFLSGNTVSQYQVSADGPVPIQGAQTGWHAGSTAVPTALRTLLNATSSPNDFQAEYLKVVQRSLSNTSRLQTAFSSSGVPALPTTPITLPDGSTLTLSGDVLAKQLRVVAQMIASGSSLGMRRQVFMVGLGGFDSHAYEMRDQPLLMSRVAQSVNWFLTALKNLGMLDNVVLFTASDFGRALVSNGDGCDHGWGSHHFVAGGSVKGREIYGHFPVTALGTAQDVGSGRLMPDTSVTQFAQTMAGWMGLSSTEQAQVLPNLANFSSSTRPLFL